ncbi:Rho GTPase activation protein [Russula dissimulans]|nr:Rho GTPase activation protein [Russula dissimulans]
MGLLLADSRRQQRRTDNNETRDHDHQQQPKANKDGKPGLRTWWQHITTTQKSRTPASAAVQPQGQARALPGMVFGRPLEESVKYASVQISTADSSGELYVWGYIPIVVAKCGLFLKQNATEEEGTFRISGSNERMRGLQTAFETPPRYGKSLDWKHEDYTTHDIASVFHQYLIQLPEPVVPYDLHVPFRDAITNRPYDREEVIATYKRLIHSMPHVNQYLFLYVLDLLSVFARKSEKTLVTPQDLAVIFSPGLMSHPSHELSPTEHKLSEDVLGFLIAHQDWFMLDTAPPPVLTAPPSRSLTLP